MRDQRGKLYQTHDIDSNKEFDYLDTAMVEFTVETGIDAVEFIVPQKYENRLPLVSLQFYGTTKLWWFIAYANAMVDPVNETLQGVVLKIPALSVFSKTYLEAVKEDDVTGFYTKTVDTRFS